MDRVLPEKDLIIIIVVIIRIHLSVFGAPCFGTSASAGCLTDKRLKINL